VVRRDILAENLQTWSR